MVQIIDLNRYGVVNWLADSVLGNLTRNGLLIRKKKISAALHHVALCEFARFLFPTMEVHNVVCYRLVTMK